MTGNSTLRDGGSSERTEPCSTPAHPPLISAHISPSSRTDSDQLKNSLGWKQPSWYRYAVTCLPHVNKPTHSRALRATASSADASRLRGAEGGPSCWPSRKMRAAWERKKNWMGRVRRTRVGTCQGVGGLGLKRPKTRPAGSSAVGREWELGRSDRLQGTCAQQCLCYYSLCSIAEKLNVPTAATAG